MPKKLRSTSEKGDFFSKKTFFKYFPLTLRTQFWQLSPNLLGRKAKNLALNYQKRWERFFPKISSSKISYGQVERCFDNPNYFFWQKFEDLSLNVRKWRVFFHKIAFLHNFRIDSESSVLTAGPKKFSTQSHNFFVECRKCLYFVYLNFSSKCFDGHVRYCFDNPAESFQKKDENIMLNVLKGWKTVFIWKNSLLERIPMYTQDAGLTCPPKFFRQKAPKFSFIVQKRGKKIKVSKTNYFHLKCCLDA